TPASAMNRWGRADNLRALEGGTVPFSEDTSQKEMSRSDAQPFAYDRNSTNDYRSSANGYSQPTTSTIGIEQRLSLLEQQVSGASNRQASLPARLAALETIVFSLNADHTGSLSERLDRLSAAVGLDRSSGSNASPPVEYK